MKIRNLFNRKKSREIAKDRLKILLISDRVNCSPEMMEMIKKGVSADEALKKCTGSYGRFATAAKYIDPRKE